MIDDEALRVAEAGVEFPEQVNARLRGTTALDSLPKNARVYLTASAALDLAHSGRFAALVEEFEVFVEARAIWNARAAQGTRTRRDAVAAQLAKLSARLATGLATGKYHTFVPAPAESGASASDLTVGALIDLAGTTATPQHAVVVDDRLASGQLMIGDSPVITLQNVLAELRASGHITDAESFAVLLRLRKANCRFLDLETDEITHWLSKAKIANGMVQATEALRILRIYLNAALSDRNLRVAPLPQTDPKNRAIGEGAFAMNSALAVMRAIGEVWSRADVSTVDRMAQSDWILRNLYTGTYGVHHLYGGFKEPPLLMAVDQANLLTSIEAVLDGDKFDFERGAAFIEWLEGRLVRDRLTIDAHLLAATVAQINKSLASIVLDQHEFGRVVVRAIYSLLPERIKIAGASDTDFVKKVDLGARPSIRIAGFELAEDEFWAAVGELHTKREITVSAGSGEGVRISHAPAKGPQGLVFSRGAEKRLYADKTFWSLAFDTSERQREHLRQHPEIFDVPDAMLNDALDDLIARPTAQERLKRLQDLKERSAASFYTRLRDSLGHEDIAIEDFVPPVASLLRHYLPGYLTGTTLDCSEAFAPLLHRADLLDTMARAVVMPVPLPNGLATRFKGEPEEKRRAILDSLAAEAASPVAQAQVAILGFAGGSEVERQLAFTLVDKLCDERNAAELELFRRTTAWVYWRLSFVQELASDVRLLLTWTHSARLVGLFVASGIDPHLFTRMFLAQGPTVADDTWTRSQSSRDVLHPLATNDVAMTCAAAAHVARSITAEEDTAEVTRRLDRGISTQLKNFIIPLMRDLSLATNINESFMATDVAAVLQSVGAETSEHIGCEAKMSLLSDSMSHIDSEDNVIRSWRTIAAIVGHLPPPAGVHSWLQKKVMDSSVEQFAVRADALEAIAVLADLQTYFDEDYRQCVEDLAVAAITEWQKATANQEPALIAVDAQRWTIAAVALAARPGLREATGAALGRVLQRLIDAAPATAPTARAMLTMLPFRLPMEYLPALWPTVIASRAAAG
jgi:hypothetical protein